MSTTRYISPQEPATRRPPDAALVVCAYGVHGGPGSATVHAQEIRRRGLFGDVRACCLHGDPSLARVLDSVRAPRVFVVPLLMAEGHTARVKMSRAVEEADDDRVVVCRPIGTVPGLTRVIATRAELTCATQGWHAGACDLVVVGHGTRRDPNSSAVARRHAERLNGMNGFASVTAAFLEEPPHLAEALAVVGGRHCVVVGLFADSGLHGDVDVRTLIAAADTGALYAGPVGTSPAMADLIVGEVADSLRSCSGGLRSPSNHFLARRHGQSVDRSKHLDRIR